MSRFILVLLMPLLTPAHGFVSPLKRATTNTFCSTATHHPPKEHRIFPHAVSDRKHYNNNINNNNNPLPSSSPTALSALIDVPNGFFTVTFIGAGLLVNISNKFARLRMEERAWEQRLEEGRRRRLEEDPTLTEIDLRRQEAAMEWSAYGKPRQEEEAYRKRMEQEEAAGRGRNRVRVMEREEEEDEDYLEEVARDHRMTDEEIDRFEIEFGIDYDPYYDDPYTEDELPEGKRQVNKRYGDVIYEDGEIFYKDAQTGLYYRQGARPRKMTFYN